MQEPSLVSPQCWELIQAPCPGEGAPRVPRTIQPAQVSSVLWAGLSPGGQNRAFTFFADLLCSISSPSPHLLPSGRPFSLSLSLFNIYLFLTVLGLSCRCKGFSPVVAYRLSFPMACGILAPLPGIKPVSPVLEGRFLTTGPPGKS